MAKRRTKSPNPNLTNMTTDPAEDSAPIVDAAPTLVIAPTPEPADAPETDAPPAPEVPDEPDMPEPPAAEPPAPPTPPEPPAPPVEAPTIPKSVLRSALTKNLVARTSDELWASAVVAVQSGTLVRIDLQDPYLVITGVVYDPAAHRGANVLNQLIAGMI